MVVSSLTTQLAKRLFSLLSTEEWVPLELNIKEEKHLFEMLDRKGSRTPLGRPITVYRLSKEVEFFRAVLHKFLRQPHHSRGIAIEERAWHAASTHTHNNEELIQGLEKLVSRAKGSVIVLNEGDRTRLIVPDASNVLSRIAVAIDWSLHADRATHETWFVATFGWSHEEAFWWRYFERPDARSYLLSVRDVEVILW